MATSNQGQAASALDCLQMWTDELKLVENALVKAEAEAEKACACYESIRNIKIKLTGYQNQINTTHDIIVKIEAELDILFAQIHYDVCEKTSCTVEAMQILYCYIKNFFECLDDLSEEVMGIISSIECLNLSKPSIILECLKKLMEKLNAIVAMQEEIIKMIIEIVQAAIEIDKLLCLEEGTYSETAEDKSNLNVTDIGCSVAGFVYELCDYYSKPSDMESSLPEGLGEKTIFMTPPCTDLDKKFPIVNNEPESFYTELSSAVSNIDIICQQAKDDCDEKRKCADEIKACKENLINAIAAATEAKACK